MAGSRELPIEPPLIDFQTRVFQVWAYSVGMSRLLLRSVRGSTQTTRVDVLFQGVTAMKLPTSLHGLVIWAANDQQTADIAEETGLLPDEDYRFFVLSGTPSDGYVVAAACVHAEDDREYFEPSKLWHDR